MDEREAHDLLSTAAAGVVPSDLILAARAERKYASRRARVRAVSALVVIAVVGSGVATAAVVSRKTASPPVAEPTPATISLTPLSSGSTTTTSAAAPAFDPRAISAMSFIDGNIGFGLVADSAAAMSAAMRTDDGGRTWRRVGTLGEFEAGIHFENATDGVAWGNGPLEATTDGGVIWHDGGGPVDNYLAWAGGRLWAMTPCVQSTPCGSRWLLISDDAGRTWQRTAPLRQGLGAATIIATSRSTAYVVEPASDRQTGGPWQLAWTTDGGASWTYRPVPCPTWTQSPTLAFNGAVLALVCVGQPAGDTTMKQTWTSSDDGRTWSRGGKVLGQSAELFNVGATILADSGRTSIYASTDEGRSWQVSLAAEAPPFITVLPGVGAWASILAGLNNGVWFSADGIHWERRTPG